MRLFQNAGVYAGYRRLFDQRQPRTASFQNRCNAYLADRYGASHLLKPVLDRDEKAFFTNGDDVTLQNSWAQENGHPAKGDLTKTLLNQIEDHNTEIFYNLDPLRFNSAFIRRLPGCVKATICWRAAPSPGADFGNYDLVVCNFPGILDSWRGKGWNARYFAPAVDPVMNEYCQEKHKPTDVCFVGGFSRHHRNRAIILESVASLSERYDVRYYMDRSLRTKLSEHILARLLPLKQYRRPALVRTVSREPCYGRDLYSAFSSSKIVLNGAIDMAGSDRGNMRCFEAMGTGALLVTDQGNYPAGMEDGVTMLTYGSPEQAKSIICDVLENWCNYKDIAENGREMAHTRYSKQAQWVEFERLVGLI